MIICLIWEIVTKWETMSILLNERTKNIYRYEWQNDVGEDKAKTTDGISGSLYASANIINEDERDNFWIEMNGVPNECYGKLINMISVEREMFSKLNPVNENICKG